MKKIVASLFSVLLISSFTGNSAIAAGYLGASFGSADIEGTDDSSSKVFGGYRQDSFGFEAAYHDLGEQEET